MSFLCRHCFMLKMTKNCIFPSFSSSKLFRLLQMLLSYYCRRLTEDKVKHDKTSLENGETYLAFLQINNPKFRVKWTRLWIKMTRWTWLHWAKALISVQRYYISIAVETWTTHIPRMTHNTTQQGAMLVLWT